MLVHITVVTGFVSKLHGLRTKTFPADLQNADVLRSVHLSNFFPFQNDHCVQLSFVQDLVLSFSIFQVF